MGSATTPIKVALETALAQFEDKHPISKHLYDEAVKSMPGGNTRSLLHEAPFPVIMKRGEGYKLFNEDGYEYVDLVGELTAGLFGHSHPVLLDTLAETARTIRLSLGATNALEARYAKLLCERFGLDQIRFANSGTEGNLHALAAARKYTGRRKIIVCTGGYHGGVLTFAAPVAAVKGEVDDGQMELGQAENNVDPDSFVLVKYNDPQDVIDAFEREGGHTIAGVLVEPMQGSAGFIPATYEFLLTIQEQCEKAEAVFIIDEVMTSRLAPGGLKSTFCPSSSGPGLNGQLKPPIRPGLTTFGKYLGGGMPFGAFGGSANIMAVYDPRMPGTLFHSGTFQNNTLMLSACYAAMSEVYTPERAIEHSQRGEALKKRLRDAVKGTKMTFIGVGSILCLHASETWGRTEGEIRNREEGGWEEEDIKTLFWLEMLDEGYWVQRRGSVALILDIPDAALDGFVEAIARFVKKYEADLFLCS